MPATPQQLLTRLDELAILYTHHQHPAVFTVEQAQQHCSHIPGGHCKNLFLRNKKKQSWLIVLRDDAWIDLKQMGKDVGAGTLGFASKERLWEFLGVIPGAVTPFALINDVNQQVNIVIDDRLMSFEQVNFHPLVNTATLSVSPSDLLKFIRANGHEPIITKLAPTPAL